MSKNIIIGQEAREKLFEGIEKVSKPVMVTMGPKGKNVLIQNGFGNPISTNDGVTVAKSIDLSDNALEQGANLIKEAAGNTNKEAGDGTTTTTTLAYSIVKSGMKKITSGMNPFSLSKNLNSALDLLKDELKKTAIPVKDSIKNIATISAQNEEVGSLIAEIMEELGHDGLISVEKGKSLGIHKEIVQGMEVDQGWKSHFFVNNQYRQESIITDAAVIVTDKTISDFQDIAVFVNKLIQTGVKNLVIFAEDIVGDALHNFILNLAKGQLNICCVKLPGYQGRKTERMKDIAVVTDSAVISDNLGSDFKDLEPKGIVGFAEKIVVSKNKTLIIGGAGTKESVTKRVEILKEQMKIEKSDYTKKLLNEQIAKLSGGVAVIRVGAPTEVETINKKHKIDDAVNATKAAIEEGIIAGGGFTLIQLANKLKHTKDQEYNTAIDILKEALELPLKQIAENAGYKGDHIIEEVKRTGKGFNAKTNEYGDLVEMGVIDPAKVLRIALENAISVAITVLTTDCLILNEKTKDGE